MHEIILTLFCRIAGLSAASGLLLQGDNLYIVSDNSNYLYEYSLGDQQLQKILLIDSSEPNEHVQKKHKLDLESITQENDTLYLFGSGSKANRNHLFKVSLDSQRTTLHTKQEFHLKKLQNDLLIAAADFNIEGSIIHNGYYYLFNRGNGPNQTNGIIKVDTSFKQPAEFFPFDLPKTESGRPGFTDAILVNGVIYFLAAIEHSAGSTYEDGQIGGSFWGSIDFDKMKMQNIIKISDQNKFEGITYLKEDNNFLSFLLCEDPDDDSNESLIYKLSVPR